MCHHEFIRKRRVNGIVRVVIENRLHGAISIQRQVDERDSPRRVVGGGLGVGLYDGRLIETGVDRMSDLRRIDELLTRRSSLLTPL